ncbi:ABC transporter substrate-binding protein [Thermoanaerobacterium thermosulfurigenes]|uniref:ABC transporter substrate-binding protein n=1 Tax=Thermoanaerobacterium thermosulfurigenes TaxID=33950 RepID=UPI003EF419A6
MKNYKKIISVMLICVISGLLLIGCNSNNQNQKEENQITSSSANKKVTIEFWAFGGLGQEQALWKKLTYEFNQSQNEVHVNLTLQDWASREEKMITSFNSGVAPDLISLGPAIDEYKRMGIITPIDDVSPQLAEKVRKDVLPDVVKMDTRDGKLWAIPSWVDLAPWMLYNTDIMKKAGLDPNNPPKTWHEFEIAAQKMTSGGVSGYTSNLSIKNQADPATEFIWYLWQVGGSIMSDDQKKITFNDQAGLNAIQFLVDLNKKYKTFLPNAPDITYMDRLELFFGGKIATAIGYTYLPGIMKDLNVPNNFHFIYAPMPKPEPNLIVHPDKVKSKLIIGNGDLHIISSSKKKDAVVKFLTWLVDNDYWHYWVTDVKARTPVDIASYTDPKLRAETEKVFPNLVKEYDEKTLTAGASPKETYAGVSQIEKTLSTYVTQIVVGNLPPKQGLDEAAQKCQQLLDEYNNTNK